MRKFLQYIKPTPEAMILDVGGFPGCWRGIPIKSRIKTLNVHPIEYIPEPGDPRIETIIGDGCGLDFPNQSFDVAFSNSVIEHVGTLERQKAFAAECRRVAHSLWVQTPARSFFLEPHLLAPLIHFFPKKVQRKLIRNFTVWGLLTRPTIKQVDDFLAEVRLLNYQEMRELFPDCVIIREKFMGFTKSYIAVRSPADRRS